MTRNYLAFDHLVLELFPCQTLPFCVIVQEQKRSSQSKYVRVCMHVHVLLVCVHAHMRLSICATYIKSRVHTCEFLADFHGRLGSIWRLSPHHFGQYHGNVHVLPIHMLPTLTC